MGKLLKNKKEIKIKWFMNKDNLMEEYQKTGMLFAFVTDPKIEGGIQVCHSWVKCRDFMPDAVKVQITKSSCNIYGFNYKEGKNPPIDLKKMRMLVTKDKIEKDNIGSLKNKMIAAEKLLNHFEKYGNISLSKLEEINPAGSSKESIYMFTGSSIWVTSPFMISLYTFLIRLGDKEIKFEGEVDLLTKLRELSENKVNNDVDIVYLRHSWNKLHSIVKNRDKLFIKKEGVHDINLTDMPINIFHHRAGIQNLIKGQTPSDTLNKLSKKYIKNYL